MVRPALSLSRLAVVWAPLALTFLLVTGSTPIINAAINRLPARDHAADLAAFAVLLACTIVIHSPLFVSREIAIKMSIHRAGSRRALRFCLATAAVVACVELLMGATPLGALVLGGFTDRETVIAAAQPAFLIMWPVPLFIAVRGVYQAHQIRRDDTLWVGLGTLVRLGLTGAFGFAIAPRAGFSGPVLGAVCVLVGVATETVFAIVRARAVARPPEHGDAEVPSPLRFGLPLMFANALGVAASLFYVRLAGEVVAAHQKTSLAAFQEVKSLHWLLGAGGFALQSLTTAKMTKPADRRPLIRFAIVAGCGLSMVLALIALTPIRDWVLVDLMNEAKDGDVYRFARIGLALAVPMPLYTAIRFTLRGILISQARTKVITAANLLGLGLLSLVMGLRLFVSDENGALNAYVVWNVAVLLELVLLGIVVSRKSP